MPKTPLLREHQVRNIYRFADSINSSSWRTGQSATVLGDMQVQVHESGQPPKILFSQEEADGRVSVMLKIIDMMAKAMNTELPLPHVDSAGALATFELDAFVAVRGEARDDYVAVASGIISLFTWTSLLASLRGDFVPRSLTYWCPGIRSTPRTEQLLCMVLPTANVALGLPTPNMPVDAMLQMLKEWKELDSDGEMTSIGLRAGAFVMAHEAGHWANRHGDQFRSKGGFSTADYHRAEFEADAFAVHHFRPLVGGGSKLASEIWPLYALFAITPQCLEAYPSITDGRTHPHPLKRLSRVLRACCPDNVIEQDAYMHAAIEIIDIALAATGKEPLSDRVSLRDIRAFA